MNHLLEWDIVESPDLALQNGKLPVLHGLGLGFILDNDVVGRPKENYRNLV